MLCYKVQYAQSIFTCLPSLPDFPHQPTHTHTQPESCCPSITPWGAPWRLYGGRGALVTRVMSGTYVPFSRSLGLGSREGAAGVVGCGMQVSQSTYSIHLQQEMQPCRTLAAFPKGSR